MKRVLFSMVAFAAAVCLLTSCQSKKGRLDDIVKDLSADSYSLSFAKTNPDHGITKTSYGTESFIVYADPQDMICPEPWRIRFPKSTVPIFRFPTMVRPIITCPEFVPLNFGDRVTKILTEADPQEFSGIKQIKLVDGKNVLLANEKFTSQYASLKADMIDDSILSGLDYNKFLLLQDPGNLSAGFTRYFYGNASMTTMSSSEKFDFGRFRPVLIGCLDPKILTLIREKFAAWKPELNKWQLTRSENDSTVAVLSQQ